MIESTGKNNGLYSWYCKDCAYDIGFDEFSYRDWMWDFYPLVGHPMFETREQMTTRELKKVEAK